MVLNHLRVHVDRWRRPKASTYHLSIQLSNECAGATSAEFGPLGLHCQGQGVCSFLQNEIRLAQCLSGMRRNVGFMIQYDLSATSPSFAVWPSFLLQETSPRTHAPAVHHSACWRRFKHRFLCEFNSFKAWYRSQRPSLRPHGPAAVPRSHHPARPDTKELQRGAQ